MKLGGKEIKDDCKDCGEILTCELCRQGHGIGRPRENVLQMLECQFERMERRKSDS